MSETYYIDKAMCGDSFSGSVERIAQILKGRGYDVEALNWAPTDQVPCPFDETVWLETLVEADED